MATIESLTTALQELEGFAKRNQQRAETALAEAKAGPPTLHYLKLVTECEARLHEAERVYLVIRERVREALR